MHSILVGLAVLLPASVTAAAPSAPPVPGRVVFAEDFEAFDRKRWDDVAHPGALEIVPGGPSGKGSCVQITATLGKDTGSHLYKMLDPGLDVCHLRFHVKFEKEHEYIHHFVHLCGYKPATRWPQGGAGERPAGDRRFSTGIEPWGNWGKAPPPGLWHFYSYWHEMKPAKDGKFWGNHFEPDPPVPVVRDRWIAVEIRLACNTAPDKADGEQAVWIDGQPAGRWGGIRWRTDPALKVNGIWILDYITENAARQNDVTSPRTVNRLWFDDIVVSDGPLR
jgi:hypothetical protein